MLKKTFGSHSLSLVELKKWIEENSKIPEDSGQVDFPHHEVVFNDEMDNEKAFFSTRTQKNFPKKKSFESFIQIFGIVIYVILKSFHGV